MENKFRVLDMAKEKDCFISNKQIVRAYKLSQGDVFTIYPSDFHVMPRFEVGDCTTAIAALNTGRNFICFEKNKDIFEVGEQRIAQWGNHNLLKSAT